MLNYLKYSFWFHFLSWMFISWCIGYTIVDQMSKAG